MDGKFTGDLIYDSPEGVDLTAVTKLKHADLWAAARKFKNRNEFAEHLGVRVAELNNWINLHRCPPASPVGRKWTEEFIFDLETKLVALTGKSWEELFPDALRNNIAFLECGKTIEKRERVEASALEYYVESTTKRLVAQSAPDDPDAEQRELNANFVESVLQKLNPRAREVIKLRYGLGDSSECKTLSEAALIVGVTRERIRKIEAKALRRLQLYETECPLNPVD
jgi:RNA polymerase sigma factor (sigma-70 family)